MVSTRKENVSVGEMKEIVPPKIKVYRHAYVTDTHKLEKIQETALCFIYKDYLKVFILVSCICHQKTQNQNQNQKYVYLTHL